MGPWKVRQVEQSLFDASAPAPPVGSADKLQGDLGIGQDDRDPLLDQWHEELLLKLVNVFI